MSKETFESYEYASLKSIKQVPFTTGQSRDSTASRTMKRTFDEPSISIDVITTQKSETTENVTVAR